MNREIKCWKNGRSHNGRFGVMAAVVPQKRQCKIETLYPAGSSVEAATTPSRWDVTCKSVDSASEDDRNMEVNYV